MSIKNKRTGPAPLPQNRWQELAVNPRKAVEAVREYQTANPGKHTLMEAHKIVTDYRRRNGVRF